MNKKIIVEHKNNWTKNGINQIYIRYFPRPYLSGSLALLEICKKWIQESIFAWQFFFLPWHPCPYLEHLSVTEPSLERICRGNCRCGCVFFFDVEYVTLSQECWVFMSPVSTLFRTVVTVSIVLKTAVRMIASIPQF